MKENRNEKPQDKKDGLKSSKLFEKNEKHKDKKHDKENKKINEQIKKLEKTNNELNDKNLRLAAEMQNIKKRNEEQLSRILKYEGERLIVELLPIIDNFERAIGLDDDNLADELSKFLEGFKMIYASLIGILKTHDVLEIEALGKPFNPSVMEAVMVESRVEEEAGIVVDVLQKGYMYKDKVIRVAMVKVNE